jgi:hypothetical protein
LGLPYTGEGILFVLLVLKTWPIRMKIETRRETRDVSRRV